MAVFILFGFMIIAGFAVLGFSYTYIGMKKRAGDFNNSIMGGKILEGLAFIAVALWIFIIMGFSSNNGEESGAMSQKVLTELIDATQIVSSAEASEIDETTLLFYEKVIRKMAHMCEYGILAQLTYGAFFMIKKIKARYAYLAGVISAFIVGSVDEYNQSFSGGRTSSPKDVLVDCIGAILAIFIVVLASGACHRIFMKLDIDK